MTGTSRILRTLVVVAGLLVSVVLPGPLTAQEDKQESARRRALLEGTELFRRILCDKKCDPLAKFEDLDDDPKQSILVVLGDANEIRNVSDKLATFIRRGGAALIASDRPLDPQYADQLKAAAGVTILGRTMICNQEDACYHKPYCPLLVPVEDGMPPLFGQKYEYKVATNLPSMLIPRVEGESMVLPGMVRPVALLPSGCSFEKDGIQLGWGPLFAVGGDVGEGRILVLADHSIFINEMMLPQDNNNVEFTEACVDWLKGEDGKRKNVLFVEDGRIKTKFDIPLKSINIPIEEAARAIFERRNQLLVEAERGLAQLESNNAFNNGLVEFLDNMGLRPDRLFGLIVTFGALAMLVWFVGRGIRRRFQHDTSVPVLAHAVSRNLPAAPVVEQRHDTLLKKDNLWEPAALLARRWFARLGVERVGGPAPAFAASGSWWQRRKVVGRLRRFWRMACGEQPQRVSAPELWRLQRELDQLRVEWERGTWQVVGTGAQQALEGKG
jgi:hypothetical protein